jgi:Protein of unknown function (DUF551)
MSTWQPIETAPKDGTRILITSNWTDYANKPLGCEVGRWDGFQWVACEKEPTHWMPLPEPPSDPARVGSDDRGKVDGSATESSSRTHPAECPANHGDQCCHQPDACRASLAATGKAQQA